MEDERALAVAARGPLRGAGEDAGLLSLAEVLVAHGLSRVAQRRAVAVEADFVASRQVDGDLFAVPDRGMTVSTPFISK